MAGQGPGPGQGPGQGIVPYKYKNYLVQSLSGGNKKKLAVALANVGCPALLAMDECTSGVAPAAAERIVRYLKHIDHQPHQPHPVHPAHQTLTPQGTQGSQGSQGSASNNKGGAQGLLFASHRIEECVSTCSRVVLLVEGAVYFDGSVLAFDELASLFYQVDVVLVHTHSPTDTATQTYTPGATAGPGPGLTSASESASGPGLASGPAALWWEQCHGSSSSPLAPSSPQALRLLQVIATECCPTPPTHPTQPTHPTHPTHSTPPPPQCFERVVEYSSRLLRLTFEKRVVPLSLLWRVLGRQVEAGVVERYAFRRMGMEEALATIIASSKGM